MTRWRWLPVLVLAGLLAGGRAHAEGVSRDQVPEPLRPWVDWVLHDRDEVRCPFLQGGSTRQCTWPSRLVLEVDDRGGRFTQQWLVERTAWVPLPGDDLRWPLDVRVDGSPQPVTLQRGAPSVRLNSGSHSVTGTFAWNHLPDQMPIPSETGLVSLTLRGGAVPFPNRDPQNRLWLERREATEATTPTSVLDVVIYRRVSDDVPLLLTTHIDVRAAGEEREVVFPRALPEHFVPMTILSSLPTRVESDGTLRMQVRPGRWAIEIVAHHDLPVESITLPPPEKPSEKPWNAEEIWVFEAQPRLRLVTIEGVPAVDPQQTDLPDEWKRLAAYRMTPGATMKLVERRRGDRDPAPDRLSLKRRWWLDFDGGGYTIRDDVTGTMNVSWRLEMAPPTSLGRAAIGGRDQFITRLGDDGSSGIEIRQGEITLQADSRLPRTSASAPAVGWNHDFHDASIELEIPPGWRLVHAFGPDAVSSSWIGDWTLLDLFVVLIVGLGFARLAGARVGMLALVTLALTYPETDAPRALWLGVLAAQALVGLLPAGRPARVARLLRLLAIVLLVLAAVPFMVRQLRQGMYPGLEGPQIDAGHVERTASSQAAAPAARREGDADAMLAAGASMHDLTGSLDLSVDSSKVFRTRQADRSSDVDPNAMITTGPGVPRWSWRAVSLQWRGPVEHTQELRLVLLSPRMNLLLACLRVALLAALAAMVVRMGPPALAAFTASDGAPVVAALLGALALLAAPSHAGADFPAPELLEQLRARLIESPACYPTCASSARLWLEIRPTQLVARMELESAAPTAVPLPGGIGRWVPETVLLDGQPGQALSSSSDGSLWIELSPGQHQVVLAGPLPDVDSVQLPLPLRPHHVDATAEGWTLEGLRDDGIADANLELRRVREEGSRPRVLQPGTLPSFARVERTMHLGLTREVETHVTRLSPADVALLLEVPLLDGESVTTADLRIENGRVLVNMSPQVTTASWRSILAEHSVIELRAPDAASWTEAWVLDTAAVWHVEARGLPLVLQPPTAGGRIREWRPWPGETVTIDVSRPDGVPGPTLTIDASVLEILPGRRATDATLTLTLRSSRGGDHVITLPDGATLESVTMNNWPQPIRQEGRSVTIPVTPTSQTAVLKWREPRGIVLTFRSSALGLGTPSVNAEVRVTMPADRWTLLVGGAYLGPAVLFWSVLAVLTLLSFALGRTGLTPLRAHDWFLLGIGLTQVNLWPAALVAGWLFALGWRRRHGGALRGWRFDLVQVLLAAWTAGALLVLFHAIEQGLLGSPEMQIAGNGSTATQLRWYWDRADDAIPQAWVISAPLVVYRVAMLAWALWIAAALLRWLRWTWDCISTDGLWQPLRLGRSPTHRTATTPPVDASS